MHGEEFGGADVDSPLVWVFDPIDGTFNYAAGLPTAAILLALVREGEPVAGLTWLPFTGQRFTAVVGKPLTRQRSCSTDARARRRRRALVGAGTFDVDSRGRLPGRYRLAVIERLSRKCSRMRMHGAIGIDLAYTAAGILGGAISFSGHVWDHAAGVASGAVRRRHRHRSGRQRWRVGSPSAVVGMPGVHGELLDILRSVGDPEDFP